MSHVHRVNGLLRSAAMTRRRPPAHGARNSGAPVLRALAIAVALGGIGAGTWVLGTEPDERPASGESQVLTVPGVPGIPGVLDTSGTPAVSRPPLSVAPAPPAAASSKRDSVARATRKDRETGAKAPQSANP